MDQARQLKPSSEVYQALHAGMPSSVVGEINDLIDDLKGHPADSLDAFLQTRPHALALGRRMISALMAIAIRDSEEWFKRNQPARDEDWLRLLASKMWDATEDHRDFSAANAGLKIVTFNFDSHIEGYLARSLRSLYRIGEDAANDLVAQIGIVHVHGRLPPAGKLTPDWIDEAAKCVKIVVDKDILADTSAAATNAVSEARVLCFLGFGYHRQNLWRLQVQSLAAQDKHRGRERDIYGSAFGLRPGEHAWIKNRFSGLIELGAEGQNCVDVLRNFYVFRD